MPISKWAAVPQFHNDGQTPNILEYPTTDTPSEIGQIHYMGKDLLTYGAESGNAVLRNGESVSVCEEEYLPDRADQSARDSHYQELQERNIERGREREAGCHIHGDQPARQS